MRIAAHSFASGREIVSRRRHRVTMPRSRRRVHPVVLPAGWACRNRASAGWACRNPPV